MQNRDLRKMETRYVILAWIPKSGTTERKELSAVWGLPYMTSASALCSGTQKADKRNKIRWFLYVTRGMGVNNPKLLRTSYMEALCWGIYMQIHSLACETAAAANIYRSHSLVLAAADNISMLRSQSVWWNILGKHLNWSTAPLIFLCVARRLQPQNRVSSRHNFQLGRALSTMDYSAHRILWLSNIVTCNDVLLVETIFIAIGNILS